MTLGKLEETCNRMEPKWGQVCKENISKREAFRKPEVSERVSGCVRNLAPTSPQSRPNLAPTSLQPRLIPPTHQPTNPPTHPRLQWWSCDYRRFVATAECAFIGRGGEVYDNDRVFSAHGIGFRRDDFRPEPNKKGT